ncbi:hypothetical protein H5410_037100 [Solanum commersonii]|uniref:Uncharacterized protein n=1 Tax=Solanum commersonii TaxID=4109 RepID=A0A9J5Y9A5_SOLCO|nr:hypothetical protein H5410_037100 [Solanum commersonii]
MAYCEEIHPVPPEDSWIVPLDVIEREIPPPYKLQLFTHFIFLALYKKSSKMIMTKKTTLNPFRGNY